MVSQHEQIRLLKNRFTAPAALRILSHEDCHGRVLPCCRGALTQFSGATRAAWEAKGVCGVIDHMSGNFRWGCIPCIYLCECIKYADHLFCTATMGVGLEAFRLCQDTCSGDVPFQLVTVELINVFGKNNVNTWKKELSKTEEMYFDRPIQKMWLEDDAGYHNLFGIVDAKGNLTLCDYDAKFFFPRSVGSDEASTVSLRVAHWHGCASLARGEAPLKTVNWSGLQLTLDQWEDIGPQRVPSALTRTEQFEQLTRAFTSPSCDDTFDQDSVSDASIATDTTTAASPMAPRSDPTEPAPSPVTLLITGIHMGPNPCPGVGVARAVRAAFPDARIVAADDAKFSDPVFSEFRKVEELGNTVVSAGASMQQQWDIVAGILQELHDDQKTRGAGCTGQGVYYLACRDRDIDVTATAKSALCAHTVEHAGLLVNVAKHFAATATTLHVTRCASDDSTADGMATNLRVSQMDLAAAQLAGLADALLCPFKEVLDLTAKPHIYAMTQGPLGRFFHVPEHFALTHTSLLEARFFAETQGYPIMVKGRHQGAQLCHGWRELNHVLVTERWVSGGFLQRTVPGWEKCLAFAAYNGELTGACMMTKGSYTNVGKVWSGDIEPVPGDLLDALRSFAAITRWTGGGELEFIEEIVPTSHSGVGRWAIDFNARFPAWIFASAYAGCNLPALLLRHAQHAREHPTACWAHPSLAAATTIGDTRASFVRSIVEIPITHIEHCRRLPEVGILASAGKLGGGEQLFPAAKFSVLPGTCTEALMPDHEASEMDQPLTITASQQVHHVAEDLQRLVDAVVTGLAANPSAIEHSPRFVLNIASVDALLKRNQRIMQHAVDTANAQCSVGNCQPLQLQMCLSVKTQPNTQVVQAARANGYLAECIDMAEVYHSVDDAGFSFERVVLTGPGKWWDRLSPSERATQSPHLGSFKLHAVFADSLADLRTIVARLLDPTDPLDAEVVGIRWAALWATQSRFGLDHGDDEVVQEAAEIIASLPVGRFRLGMHFHHAASVLGGRKWFALANAFAVFCGSFGTLSGCAISTIDFGGGFEPHFLESEFATQQLSALFATVHVHCNHAYRPAAAGPVCVQFELGKSVSEDAGGVLTRILAIRERRKTQPKSRALQSTTVRNCQSGDEEDARAIIVDTTIADVSTYNNKPVFLVRMPSPDAPPATLPQCIPLAAGDTHIWGRTCMEWDMVKGSFVLPADVCEGDLLLIAGCGAYDMSMQYDFGDGQGRSKNVIVL